MIKIPELFPKNTTLNFAHRGYTKDAPENSIAAFKAAATLGVDGIEFDVRVCASGEVVVFHDQYVKRMTGMPGQVKMLNLNDLRDLRLVQNGHPITENIPTLTEAVEAIDKNSIINIEIKSNGLPNRHRIEEKVVDILTQYDLFDRTIISSFHPLIMRRFGKLNPQIIKGFLFDKTFNVSQTQVIFTKIAKARAIHIKGSLLKSDLVKKIKARGYACVAWTINERARMNELLNLGVHAIITDRPDLLKQLSMSLTE